MKTITLKSIDLQHNLAIGTAQNCLDILVSTDRLIPGVDFDLVTNNVTISGYVFITQILGLGQDEIRKGLHFFTTEGNKDPYTIIREQLDILEKGKLTVSDSTAELITPTARKKYVVKNPSKPEAPSAEIPGGHKQVEDIYTLRRIGKKERKNLRVIFGDESEAWCKKMSTIIIGKYREENPGFDSSKGKNVAIGRILYCIYTKMNHIYGFVVDQCVKDCVNKLDLDFYPPIMRAIYEDPTFRDIFQSIVLDYQADGYEKVLSDYKPVFGRTKKGVNA